MFKYICGPIFIGWVLFVSMPVLGNDKAEAKKHFEAGLSLQKAEDFSAAVVEFKMSLKLFPTASAQYNLANCYRALHRYGDALQGFELLNNPKKEWRISAKLRRDIKAQIAEINNFIARLTLEVDQTAAEVTVNDKPMGRTPLPAPLILAPGEHTIEVRLAGFQPVTRMVSLVSREHRSESIFLKSQYAQLILAVNIDGATVVLDDAPLGDTPLEPVNLEPGSHRVRIKKEGYRTVEHELELSAGEQITLDTRLLVEKPVISNPSAAALAENSAESTGVRVEPAVLTRSHDKPSAWKWIAFGAGAGAGIAAAITGGLSLKYAEDALDGCRDTVCPPSHKDKVERAEKLGIATNVLVGVAATGAVTGLVLLLLERREKSSPISVMPEVSQKSAGLCLAGRF